MIGYVIGTGRYSVSVSTPAMTLYDILLDILKINFTALYFV